MVDATDQSNELNLIFNQIYYTVGVLRMLRTRLTFEIENGNYQLTTSLELADVINKLSDVISNHLLMEYLPKANEIQNRVNRTGDELSWLRLKITQAARVSAVLSELLEFVNGSSANVTPWRVIGQLERFSKQISPRSHLIVDSRWKFNYSFTSITDSLYKITQKPIIPDMSFWESISNETAIDFNLNEAFYHILRKQPYFYCLSFPPTGSEDILHLAVWGHELGHLFCRKINNHNLSQTDQFVLEDMQFKMSKKMQSYLKKTFDYRQPAGGENPELDDEDFINRTEAQIQRSYNRWAKEIMADVVAVRLFGPAALFAIMEVSSFLEQYGRIYSKRERYPPFHIRARILISSYERWFAANGEWLEKLPLSIKTTYELELAALYELLKRADRDFSYHIARDSDEDLTNLIDMAVSMDVKNISNRIEQETDRISKTKGNFLSSHDMMVLPSMLEDLKNGIPPRYLISDEELQDNLSKGKSLPVILNAGWLYWLSIRNNDSKNTIHELATLDDRYCDLNNLLAKAVEIAEAMCWFNEKGHLNASLYNEKLKSSQIAGPSKGDYIYEFGGVLSKEDLINRLCDDFHVLPLLDLETQLDLASIDIRLGNEFIVTKLPAVTKIDPADIGFAAQIEQFHNKIYIPFGKPFVLHPHQIVLGCTLEYVDFPKDLLGIVYSRSSWGRLGLAIITAGKVDPGFQGCITLELTNLGDVPVFLYPGCRIGQLIVHQLGRKKQI